MSAQTAKREFPTTTWSIIARLKHPDPARASQAMREIFHAYRDPLYSYLRAGGLKHEDAEDVLQGFFEKVLRNDALRTADPARGRLRSFLLTSLRRYHTNWSQKEQRHQQRDRAPDSAPGEEDAEISAPGVTPEQHYDRRWASALITRVNARLRERHARLGKAAQYDALMPYLLASEDTDSLSSLCATTSLSENALRTALHRLRKNFRRVLLEEVARTLDEGEDPQEELRYLLSLCES